MATNNTMTATTTTASSSGAAAKQTRPAEEEDPPPQLLEGKTLFFPKDMFPPEHVVLFDEMIQRYGGSITPELRSSSFLIYNPSSPLSTHSLENLAFLQRNYPDLPHPSPLPYTHLLLSLHLRLPLPLPTSTLSTSQIFIHPSPSHAHAPLRAWVSLNVHRSPGQSAEDAHRAVLRMLVDGGALPVKKRAHADLLVVDTNSKFYEVVRKEKERTGRTWQKIAERDWVESCVKSGRLTWRTFREAEEEDADADRGSEVDSMAEEEPGLEIWRGRGPGRPTGKPRIEYTSQDDDFLCRYLAAFHPDGSWQSRKTYAMLTSLSGQFPIAARHSQQSWHERFKKNASVFSRRVQRLAEEGVDRTLKTQPERERAQERERMRAEAAAEEARKRARIGDAEVHEGAQVETRAEHEGARLTRLAEQALSTAGSHTNAEAGPSRQQDPPPVPAEQIIVAEAAPAVTNGKRKLVELDDDEDDQPPQTAPVVAQEGHPDNVPQPIASSAEQLQASPRRQQRHVRVSSPPSERSPRRPLSETRPATDLIRTIDEPPAQVQVQQPPSRHSLPAPAPSTTHMSIPLRLDFDIRAPPPPPPPDTPSSASRPPPLPQAFATPSPGRSAPRRSLLQEEILLSAASKRRRQSSTPHKAHTEHQQPDTVLASTVFPPRPTAPPPPPPPPTHSTPPPTSARLVPRLTPQEHAERVLEGQRLVLKTKEIYKAKIAELCGKYGMAPKEMFQVVNALPKGGGGGGAGGGAGVYWEDVERGLRGKFGY